MCRQGDARGTELASDVAKITSNQSGLAQESHVTECEDSQAS